MMPLKQLEEQKAEILSLLDGWSPARLAYRPAPDAWSAVEVLDHLVRAEIGITAAARRGLQQPHAIGLRDRLGFFFLDRIFRSQRRVKVPSSASAVLPDPTVTLPSVIQRWDDTRHELAELLARVTPDQMQAGVFRHPVSGWMNLPNVLSFFSVHLTHHRFQLQRLSTESEGLSSKAPSEE